MIELTELEQKVLKELQRNSFEETGSDMSFGIIEQLQWDGSRQQMGGAITSLQSKGVVEVFEKTRVNDSWVTQFVLADAYRAEPWRG